MILLSDQHKVLKLREQYFVFCFENKVNNELHRKEIDLILFGEDKLPVSLDGISGQNLDGFSRLREQEVVYFAIFGVEFLRLDFGEINSGDFLICLEFRFLSG